MKIRSELVFLILLFFLYGFAYSATPDSLSTPPEEVIDKLTEQFAKIKDVRADITLDTGLQLLGCGGTYRQTGYGIYRAPDLIKTVIDNNTYIIKGNNIKRIDPEGNVYLIKLVHALDFTPGFNPRLIPYNFYLKNIRQSTDEVVLEGTPKPGILKNVRKVFFYIDTRESLLRRMRMLLVNKELSGIAEVKYQKIDDIWVPVATYGKSAVEINSSSLVGLNFNLRGSNFKINTGIPEDEFK
jgi:outer membrane lipoprotein-sorting protein